MKQYLSLGWGAKIFGDGKIFWTSKDGEVPFQIVVKEKKDYANNVIRRAVKLKKNGEESKTVWVSEGFYVFETYEEWKFDRIEVLEKRLVDLEQEKARQLLRWEEDEKSYRSEIEKLSNC